MNYIRGARMAGDVASARPASDVEFKAPKKPEQAGDTRSSGCAQAGAAIPTSATAKHKQRRAGVIGKIPRTGGAPGFQPRERKKCMDRTLMLSRRGHFRGR